LIIGGAVLIMPGLVVLLQAATAALVKAGFEDQWAALIVGGGVVVVGLILLAVGVNWLNPRSLVPDKTIGQVQRDASVAKKTIRNETRNDHDTIQRAA
jgi:ABC-type iron transport system FetAB permease component